MLHEHLAAGRSLGIDFHDMEAEGSLDYRRNIADGGGVGGVLKLEGEAHHGDDAHASARSAHGGVYRESARELFEIAPGEDGRAYRIEPLTLGGPVDVFSSGGHHDVAYVDVGLHAFVNGVDEAVFHSTVFKIWSGKIAAVAVELVLEGFALVDAFGFGVGHLLLVGDKHLEIFLDRLTGELLALVLVVEIFKLAKAYRLFVDGHKHLVTCAFGGDGTCGSGSDGQQQRCFVHGF